MPDDHSIQEIELHFQEMFNGEEASITLNGLHVASLKLTTRMQVGLAAVHRIQAVVGSSLAITIAGQTVHWKIKSGESLLGIRLENGGLHIQPVPLGHGYA